MHGEDRMNCLSLPIAGIMSPLEGEQVVEIYRRLLDTIASAGCTFHAPFLTMSFMCLPVIPQVKITDKGMFISGT